MFVLILEYYVLINIEIWTNFIMLINIAKLQIVKTSITI